MTERNPYHPDGLWPTAGSYTRTDEQAESDPRSNVGLAKHFRDQRDDLEHRLNLAVMASEHNSERAEKAEKERDELWPFRKRAETAEQALVEMTAHRDQCRDTAIKWQTEANRAEHPRPLTPEAITDAMVERARDAQVRATGMRSVPGAMRAILTAALTEPPTVDPEVQAIADVLGDVAVADEHTGDRDDVVLARRLHERGVRVTGAES